MTFAARYFVPVCLYPHTNYRTNSGATALFEKYELRSHEYLIVVADRLLVLDRLVTGRYWTVNSAIQKVRQEAKQIMSLIKRASYKAQAQANGKIVFWDAIAETGQFLAFAQCLRGSVLADQMLSGTIEEFVERRVRRFGLGNSPDRERQYEREYLLSEVCMSVFCTEVLGFWIEVWERPPAEMPDPLRLLYDSRPQLVERATGRSVTRILRFLNSEGHKER
jgi:hypothetical protein